MPPSLPEMFAAPDSTPDRNPAVTAAASPPAWAVPPAEAFSLPVPALPAADAVIEAPHAFPPEEENCAGAAHARSAEELAAAEQAHSDWASADSFPFDCLAALSADDSFPAERSAALPPDDSLPADYSAALPPVDSLPADYSAALPPVDSLPACCLVAQAGRGEHHCSLDAPPAYWPLAELRHDSLEGYKALPPLWPVRRRGR